jgi:uncharacterized protein with PCYCGC motif
MLKRVLMLGSVLLLTFSTPWATSQQDQDRVPAFHQAPPPPADKLAPILGKEQLWGGNDQFPFQARSYEVAGKISSILYQQPCYCYCDRMGHKSLRSCFETTHGAQCSTCMKEVFYSYQMSRQHKSASQIRKGIIAGEWKNINLESAPSAN